MMQKKTIGVISAGVALAIISVFIVGSLGYSNGFDAGVASRGFTVRDPTYQEAKDFVASDATHLNQYVNGSYTCWNFAADFANNAFKAGYRCGLVYMTFGDGTAHEINCFDTVDEGLVFFDAATNQFVNLEKGQLYQSTGYQALGIVDYFAIVW